MISSVEVRRLLIVALFLVFSGYVTLKTTGVANSATIDLVFKAIFQLPLLIMCSILLNGKQFILPEKKITFLYFLFVILAFSSNLWTIDFKYTFVKSSNILLVFVFFLTSCSLIGKNWLPVDASIKAFIFPSAILLAVGLLTFDPYVRDFLGGSSSLYGIIFSTSCVLSAIQYRYSRKSLYKFLTYSFFLATILVGSVRGALSLIVFFIIYRKYYKIAFILFVLFIISGFEYSAELVNSEIPIIHQIGRNFESAEAFFENGKGLSNNGSGGLRLALLINGWEYFVSNPSFFGDGYASSYSIFEKMGKRSYSHNGFLEILMGLGLVGITVYIYLLHALLQKSRRRLEVCKRISFAIVGYLLIQLIFGKIYESIYLTFLIVIYIKLDNIKFKYE
jgi:O-antigen ligase